VTDTELLAWVHRHFDGDYAVDGGLRDRRTGVEWVLAPAASFRMGMSEAEVQAAKALAPEPFLSFEEMQPTIEVSRPSFLITRRPLAWRPTLASAEDPAQGVAVRGGGGSRFWHWQDDREWAGCVSAYRMPQSATDGEPCAVRLVRAPRPPT